MKFGLYAYGIPLMSASAQWTRRRFQIQKCTLLQTLLTLTPKLITIKVMDGDDPSWEPFISYSVLYSYFIAACSTAVVYDWALTFRQEFELILRQHWSFMTVLYVCVRYIGILFSVTNILLNLPISITDEVFNSCTIVWYIQAWTPTIVNAMLGVIMIARINAMYRGSKKLLIFLIATLLVCTVASGVMVVVGNLGVLAQEAVLSGYHTCIPDIDTYMMDVTFESMTFTAVWEILALFLTTCTVIKHIRDLRHSPIGSTIGDYFRILIESHAFYFLAFATVACFMLGSTSPNITNSLSMGSAIYGGILSIAQMLQMFVLGPRLILSIRKNHAKAMARADRGIGMTFVTCQPGVDAFTGRDV
ncbi:hypothetical protein F4604DRAFT_654043 [Suillus subluteus]|nr:hypothetical protein F4604DRAFT_654043 [Suillus subluteus]